MIAYVFWHRPRDGVAPEQYEAACGRFHRSLAQHPPGGFAGSVCLAAEQLPWLGDGRLGYEDWYLLDDFGALGTLNEAAVGRGHASPHDAAAVQMGEGTGSVYRLVDGLPRLEDTTHGIWITPAPGKIDVVFEDLLVDGGEPGEATLWRRQLALGPAPEFCVLARAVPDGVRATRLPVGWGAEEFSRAVV